MERKNTLLLTVIAVATLLVAVVGATFAYFTASVTTDSGSAVTVNTSAIDTVTCESTAVTMNVLATDMLQANGVAEASENPTPTKTQTSTITCTIDKGQTATETPETTRCTYDLVYTTANAFTHTANKTVKELTLSGAATKTGTGVAIDTNKNAYTETDLSTFGAASTSTTLVDDAYFTFTTDGTVVWTWTVSMYNYAFDQSALAGHTYGGTIAVSGLTCTAE